MRSARLPAIACAILLIPLSQEGCRSDAGGESTLAIDVKVDPGLFMGEQPRPMGLGLPMPKGRFKESQIADLTIVGESNRAVPAHFELRSTWPDGSVKWLWADFSGDPTDRYQVKKLRGIAKTKQARRVTVNRADGRIRISTGKLTVTFASDKATPIQIIPADGPAITGDGLGAYVIDNRNRRGVAAGPLAKLKWDLETDNAQRAVLRLEGSYITEDGERIAGLVMRYDFRADQPFFTVEHRRIVTLDTSKVWFLEDGVTFPGELAGGKVHFGVDGTSRRLPIDEDGTWCFQSDYRRWTIRRTKYSLGIGETPRGSGVVADGWADAAGREELGGMVVCVRDFAQQFPKELSATPSGVTVKLWSARGGIPLDYRPSTLLEHFWGEELLRISKWRVYERERREPFEVKKQRITSGYEGRHRNAFGSARTHRLFCGYYSGPANPTRARMWNNAFQRPPVALPDPAWTLAAGIFPKMTPEEFKRFPREEAYISASFDELVSRSRDYPPNGWYDWGATPAINYAPNWFPGDTQDRGMIPEIFRLGYHAGYNTTKHIWHLWMRSGDRKYLDAAERQSRILADFRFSHYGADKGMVNAYLQELPLYWARGWFKLRSLQSTDSFAPMWIAYYLRDDRHAREVIEAFSDAVEKHWEEDRAHGPLPDVRFQQMMSTWQVTQDPRLVERIRYLAGEMVDANSMYGLSLDFYRHEPPETLEWRAHYKRARKLSALCEYLRTFGADEKVEAALDRATADEFDILLTTDAHSYQNYTPVLLADAYRRTDVAIQKRDYRIAATLIVRKALRDHVRDGRVSGVAMHTQMFPFYVVPQLLAIE